MKPSHLVSICCSFALTCKINTNQSAMGRGNLKISITFMVARTALQAAGQGCKVTFAPTEGQVSKNLLSNPSLYYREWAICHRRITTCPLSSQTHTQTYTCCCTGNDVKRVFKQPFGTDVQRRGLCCLCISNLAPKKAKWESLFVRRCAALKCLCPRSCMRCGILPLFFSHGEDLSPRCVNAFKFEWGVSTKLPGLC